jgi:DNA polymerase III sliding clamp (beta) subunit (PCNA family)
MKSFILKRDTLEAALRFASRDDNRYNLSGVNCEVGDDGSVTLCSTDGHRLALFAGACTTVDGQFPDYEQVFPNTANAHCATIVYDRKVLGKWLKGAAAHNKDLGCGIVIEAKVGVLHLAAFNPEQGDMRHIVHTESLFLDESITLKPFGCNARYLREALEAIADALQLALPTVSIYWTDDLSPMLLVSHDESVKMVVMPMRM